MSNLGHYIVRVLISAIVVLQLKRISRHHAAAIARGGHHHVCGFLFLHAHLGDRVALIFGGVESGIVKKFQRLAGREFDDGGIVGQQTGGWRREIVIRHGVLAGTEFLSDMPVVDHFRIVETADLERHSLTGELGQAGSVLD